MKKLCPKAKLNFYPLVWKKKVYTLCSPEYDYKCRGLLAYNTLPGVLFEALYNHCMNCNLVNQSCFDCAGTQN